MYCEHTMRIRCDRLKFITILRTHLYPRFAKLNLSEITEDHGMALMSDHKRTHSAKGIKNIWIVLKGVINKARKDKLIRLILLKYQKAKA